MHDLDWLSNYLILYFTPTTRTTPFLSRCRAVFVLNCWFKFKNCSSIEGSIWNKLSGLNLLCNSRFHLQLKSFWVQRLLPQLVAQQLVSFRKGRQSTNCTSCYSEICWLSRQVRNNKWTLLTPATDPIWRETFKWTLWSHKSSSETAEKIEW